MESLNGPSDARSGVWPPSGPQGKAATYPPGCQVRSHQGIPITRKQKTKAITMTDEKRIQNLVAAVADLEPDIDQEFLAKAATYCGGENYLREMIRVLRDVRSMKKG